MLEPRGGNPVSSCGARPFAEDAGGESVASDAPGSSDPSSALPSPTGCARAIGDANEDSFESEALLSSAPSSALPSPSGCVAVGAAVFADTAADASDDDESFVSDAAASSASSDPLPSPTSGAGHGASVSHDESFVSDAALSSAGGSLLPSPTSDAGAGARTLIPDADEESFVSDAAASSLPSSALPSPSGAAGASSLASQTPEEGHGLDRSLSHAAPGSATSSALPSPSNVSNGNATDALMDVLVDEFEASPAPCDALPRHFSQGGAALDLDGVERLICEPVDGVNTTMDLSSDGVDRVRGDTDNIGMVPTEGSLEDSKSFVSEVAMSITELSTSHVTSPTTLRPCEFGPSASSNLDCRGDTVQDIHAAGALDGGPDPHERPSSPDPRGGECVADTLDIAAASPRRSVSPGCREHSSGQTHESPASSRSSPRSAGTSPRGSATSRSKSDSTSPQHLRASSPPRSPEIAPSSGKQVPPPSLELGPRSPDKGSACTRPPPSLDHVAYTSNVSEVSEDLSVWGNLSPPNSARSGYTGAAAGHSLEVSASVETESCSRSFPGRLGDAGSVAYTNLGALEASKLPAGAMPKPWATLQAELKVLTEALQGIRSIRTKQQEFLQQLRGI